MEQLEHIGAIERRLWSAADTLRSNSNYASNEYFLPVMGLIFLRHAYSRYLTAKEEIEPTLPSRGGKVRELTKEDFSRKSAIYLRPEAQFESLVSLPDGEDRAKALIEAMDSIEADYESLRGTLPKNEYRELDNDVLGQLLRTQKPQELKKVSGDVFGRIYEYFLTQFAGDKAHDGGEFFTPISLVSLIAHVLDPKGGVVLDPACGSGGMFVQSARIVEEHGDNPTERLTFRGLEKNATTIRLAKMNMAVHGLEGDIQQAITYYEDPQELLGKADLVMANPPFNVDEIDAEKIKTDPRLPFGLPGVNKKGKVSNGNYIWISYFYSYLNATGRAGFVMSSQASSAGRDEAKVRQKLVESDSVEMMVAVRGKFFYTRGVPCELWFLNKQKERSLKGKVLMLDARNIYRQVSRSICDFSPAQEKNLLSVYHLASGQEDRHSDLMLEYEGNWRQVRRELQGFDCGNLSALASAYKATYYAEEADEAPEFEFRGGEFIDLVDIQIAQALQELADQQLHSDHCMPETRLAWSKAVAPIRKSLQELKKAIEQGGGELRAWNRKLWKEHFAEPAQTAQTETDALLELIHDGLYWIKQLDWHHKRFPEGVYQDVEGLCKLVDPVEIESNDWSLTPGRYVGVAAQEVDEDFDFEEAMQNLHAELAGLNEEAVELAARIQKNFEGLIG